jgi:hypothetical protein
MEYLRRLALAIALMAMVSLAAPAFASSVTVSANMPQILSVQFPITQNFGDLIPYTPTTVNNQLSITANCNWNLAAYPLDYGAGTPHGHLAQTHQSSPHDYIRNPVAISVPNYGIYSYPLSSYYYYSPLPITSGGSGTQTIDYQLSTQSDGSENPYYPYSIAIEFALTAS